MSNNVVETTDINSLFVSKLQSEWSFWYDDRRPNKDASAQNTDFNDYQKGLKKLGSFSTLEDFWRHYSYIMNPDAFPRECSIYLSRDSKTPAWETYPDGGCWILRVRKHNEIIDRLWEELCFACTGELFEHPDVVCVAVSTRSREDVISVWTSNTDCQFIIGKKLKELCNLDESTQVDYKTFRSAIKDGSSFKNAKPYVYNAATAATSATAPTQTHTSSQRSRKEKKQNDSTSRDNRSNSRTKKNHGSK